MHERVSRRRWALFALGLSRARSGVLARLSLGFAVLTTLGALAMVPGARRAGSGALERLPAASSSLLAWGAGVSLAFAAALQALRQDRTSGVRALATARGHGPNAYLAARVLGLAALVALVIGGGTVVVGAAAALASHGGRHAALALQGTAAGCVYATAFSATVAPVAFATLGARSRAGGYLWLLTVLVLPEALSGVTGRLVPEDWSDLVSLPGALGALRAAVSPPGFDAAHGARALVVVVAIALIAAGAARAALARADSGDDA